MQYTNAVQRIAARLPWALLVACGAFAILRVDESAGDEQPASASTPREALQLFNVLIGEWRGVGQPRRQSNKDAWVERSGWVWDLQGAEPAIVLRVDDGKLVKQARVEFDTATAEYVMTTTSPQEVQVVYRGRWLDNQLIVDSPGDDETPARRITITPRSDIRAVALFEATEPGKEVYYRVAEIGYTRQGKRLAGPGGGQPQCVVTGGLGTIEVSHQGKTYYVCCTGCKQAFEDDPDGILTEYRARLARERDASN